MQNICLVTTQSFNEGSLDTRTWKRLLSHQLFVDIMFFKTYLSHQSEKNLLLNESLTTPWTNTLLKVVKGDEMVGHLPRKLSRIVWYFLPRSAEISVEVIGRRQCGRMEVPCQLQFNFSSKVQMKLMKELLASKSRVQNRAEDSNKQLI